MTAFSDAYDKLNAAQKQAVDTIEGPLLVIAGPGTGKTQLLSARVANILQKTDTPAQNILCLTFTDNGAANMRQRLTRFIGQDAYNVTIGTYHSFGSDLINRYPEYFGDSRLQAAVDDLGKRQIVLEIVEAMSYHNPLKQTRHHIGDLLSTLSEIKRALLTSADLRTIADANAKFITQASQCLQPIYAEVTKMPSSLAKAQPLFEHTLAALAGLVPTAAAPMADKPVTNGLANPSDAMLVAKASERIAPLAQLCVAELQTALETAVERGKSTPLTQWKNAWLAKDADNNFILLGVLENQRIQALADVLDAYQTALAAKGLYDFDDMILRSIQALETNADLRYTLQERYLYILLDEFQDTNAAQLRLVQLLTDNPVNEGRPNILAVGDDDQAIYAFQGAQYSNMLQYFRMYRGTVVINLTQNYRSHTAILETASNVASQIDERIHQHFQGATKTLVAANTTITTATIERREFQSEIAERTWIASRIKGLLDSGTAPSDIAILAPKHKQLEPLVPYLNAQGIPVRYEKRENILDAPVVRQLVTMSQLLLALGAQNSAVASALWPEVLSYDFWEIPTAVIWNMSWQVSDNRMLESDVINPAGDKISWNKLTWSQAVLSHENLQVKRAAEILLAAAGRIATETCETILDYLIGSAALETHDIPGSNTTVASPLKDYYTSAEVQAQSPDIFYETLSHLTVLRAKLREFQEQADTALLLPDFIRFVDMYTAAEQPIINTSPYAQAADSVQLMTVFKAKGLEYQHVFLPSCTDDVWGANSRGNSNKLTLPPNLQPIRHAGATDDERLRILFVALTRARTGLYMTSGTRSFSGKTTKRLKYFDEQEQPDGSYVASVLPQAFHTVISDGSQAPGIAALELDWRTRHIAGLVSLDVASLLSDRTDNYQLSPTHLTSFVDLEYAGPERFFFDTILRFPSAPSPDGQFGTAIHETLEWYQHQVDEQGYAPDLGRAVDHFASYIASKHMTEQRSRLETERGQRALTAYLGQRAQIYKPGDVAEKNFRNEAVFVGDVHMSGRIDRMEINNKTRTITIVDYKTGKNYSTWKNDLKLHKYQLQLYAYKLLIEGSRSYAGYTVPVGRLEFIEADAATGKVHSLELQFDNEQTEHVRRLMEAVWTHIIALRFPDTTAYPATVTGMKQLEQDLINAII